MFKTKVQLFKRIIRLNLIVTENKKENKKKYVMIEFNWRTVTKFCHPLHELLKIYNYIALILLGRYMEKIV